MEALRVLGEALKFAPKNVQTLLLTSKIQLKRNNLQAAEQATRLALNEESENPEALTILGQVLHETDRYDEAIDVLDRALKKAPESRGAELLRCGAEVRSAVSTRRASISSRRSS